MLQDLWTCNIAVFGNMSYYNNRDIFVLCNRH